LLRPPADPRDARPEQHGGEELKVVVADYDALARRIIREALQRAQITVVAEARTGREAVDVTLRHRPQVLLMDLLFPDLDVNESITRIRAGGDGHDARVQSGGCRRTWRWRRCPGLCAVPSTARRRSPGASRGFL
jgi:CheY-like chemotaxis protein